MACQYELPDISEADFEENCPEANAKNTLEKKRASNTLETDVPIKKFNHHYTSKPHPFWSTQPVPIFGAIVTTNECIQQPKDIAKICTAPFELPASCEYITINVDKDDELEDLQHFLNENYVDDEEVSLRSNYQLDFLKWLLGSPGSKHDFHLGLRMKDSNRLIGCIFATPTKMSVKKKIVDMVDVRFLCVHKKLRNKRITPLLIQELARRVSHEGIFQANFTARIPLPGVVSYTSYWHCCINARKLLNKKFPALDSEDITQSHLCIQRLPSEYKSKGFRRIQSADMKCAKNLLDEYLKRMSFRPRYSQEQFEHWITPRENVCDCYVVESEKGKVTDFGCYYFAPSFLQKDDTNEYTEIHTAYLFYAVATKTLLRDLITDLLITAKEANVDLFKALDVMENRDFLEKLQFIRGEEKVFYFLYNWKCPVIEPAKLGVVAK